MNIIWLVVIKKSFILNRDVASMFIKKDVSKEQGCYQRLKSIKGITFHALKFYLAENSRDDRPCNVSNFRLTDSKFLVIIIIFDLKFCSSDAK